MKPNASRPELTAAQEVLNATPLVRSSLPQGRLNIKNKVRTHLFPWTGQFSPQLVEGLLTAHAPSGRLCWTGSLEAGLPLLKPPGLGWQPSAVS